MAEFKTPKKYQTPEKLPPPIRIPPSPFLQELGYGCGVQVFTLERSPKVGCVRSPWAVKKRNKRINDPKYSERIKGEASILRKLNHPNVIGFRGFASGSSGEPCLVMEKLDASLGDMIEERDGELFQAHEILKIGYEIAKGLEYLHHTAHILHGDIKSYNVLVSSDYSIVKLCDFGVSVSLTKNLEMDKTIADASYIGTECWTAPEILSEEGPVTNKADMWAYGLVLYEMIALSPPHVDSCDTMSDVMKEIMNDENSDENEDPNLSMDMSYNSELDLTTRGPGTRPLLPAYFLGKGYDQVLEIFSICTEEEYTKRPSARGVVAFFKTAVYPAKKKV
ncbi:lymphokine-activated killer T-cell-originated protein kinase [Belonocnema kinseyi]|uniref:lymphokine-activated killer T-cell-originated protein kinase n=1 Tax=Belonocnema kinseyi TaxID=2817044 RepID=UPI00143D222B|nr:lymphokine-activated killer T-cell-originated protein kinase [Belonocnema kinseyi]